MGPLSLQRFPAAQGRPGGPAPPSPRRRQVGGDPSRLMRPAGVQMYTLWTPYLPNAPPCWPSSVTGSERHGRAPSLAEIAAAFGFASRNAAQKHVQALVADGLLEQAPGQKRGIRLLGRARAGSCCRCRCWAGSPPACRSAPTSAWTSSCGWTARLFSPHARLPAEGAGRFDDRRRHPRRRPGRRAPHAPMRATARSWSRASMAKSPSSASSAAPRRIRLLPRNPAHAPIVVRAAARTSPSKACTAAWCRQG